MTTPAATSAPRICEKCGLDITGKGLTSMGKRWHKECFTCSGCDLELGSGKFKSCEGSPWCPDCYLKFKAPKCVVCSEAVQGAHVVVLGMAMHQACFKCENCHQPLRAFKPVENENGKLLVVCVECTAHFKPKSNHDRKACARCQKQISKEESPWFWEERQWHPSCFTCDRCGDQLGPENIPVKKDDLPCCQSCCQNADPTDERCHACRQLMRGITVETLGRRYHKECVCCEYCSRRLIDHSTSLRINEMGKPVCDDCYANAHYVSARPEPLSTQLSQSQGSGNGAAAGAPLGASEGDGTVDGSNGNNVERESSFTTRNDVSYNLKEGGGYLQICIRSAVDLFKDTKAREAYMVCKLGLQMLYTHTRVVAKAEPITMFDESFEFKRINVSATLFQIRIMSKQDVMGTCSMFLKDLPPGISYREFPTAAGTLNIEFTWRPTSKAIKGEPFQRTDKA